MILTNLKRTNLENLDMQLQVFTLGLNSDEENKYCIVSNKQQLKNLSEKNQGSPVNLYIKFSLSKTCSSKFVFRGSPENLDLIKNIKVPYLLLDVVADTPPLSEKDPLEPYSDIFIEKNPYGLMLFIKKCLKIMKHTQIIVSPSHVILYEILKEEFEGEDRFYLSNTYVENRILSSFMELEPVNTFSPEFPEPFIKNKFACFYLTGSLAPQYGTYDSDHFLERFHFFLKTLGVHTVHVIFANTLGTYKYQYPLIVNWNDGRHTLCLYENKNPDPLEEDMQCCLHDSIRLRDIDIYDKKRVRIEIVLTKLKMKVR